MPFISSIQSSLRVLAANRLRSGLTMLGIIIGISSVVLISSMGQGTVAFITNELSVFGTNFFRVVAGQNITGSFASQSKPLTIDDVEAVRQAGIANIEHVVPVGLANRKITSDFEDVVANVYGVGADMVRITQPTLLYGEFFSETDNANIAKVGVMGIDMVEELFGPNTNPVGQHIRIETVRIQIIGVSQSVGGIADIYNRGLTIPINTLNTHVTGEDRIFQMIVSMKDENLLNQTIQDVEDSLRDFRDLDVDEDNDFFIQSYKETLGTIQSVTGLLTLMVTAISAISLMVGGIGVMNIMLVTVTERTKEIGLLKAIGAKDKDIRSQFLIESVTLSLSGGIMGILLGLIGSFFISRLVGIPFVVSSLSVVLAVSVSSLVGIVFGLYPARRAAKLNPIDALRHE